MANLTKHNVVFDSASLASLRKNMTPSTKAEVHNVLQHRERTTKSRPQ